jgi:hypothetical protein
MSSYREMTLQHGVRWEVKISSPLKKKFMIYYILCRAAP